MNPNWKPIQIREEVYYLDTTIKKLEIRKNCPVFYKNQRITETLFLHKGCLIVEDSAQDNVVVYAYDARTKTIHYLYLKPNVRTAKKTIDRKIAEGTEITLKYETVVVTISASVEVAVFSKYETVVQTIPHAIKQIGLTEVEDKSVPDMLQDAILKQAKQILTK
jgi:hypothetical protein